MTRVGLWVAQVALAAVVGYFVWQSLAGQWDEFRSFAFPTRPGVGWILLAAVLVVTSFGFLIGAWRTVLQGWAQTLSLGRAARIWSLSNLGRYLPGKVWSLAGLSVLAARSGVAPGAAAGAALAMQALALVTGVMVSASLLPGSWSRAAIVMAVIAGGGLWALTRPDITERISHLTGRRWELRALPVRSVLVGGAAALASWVLYGTAFYAVGLGLLDTPPPLGAAIGTFAAGYIVGLLALFAPGGLGVREAVYISLLTGWLPADAAVVLAVGSRLLMTLVEIAVALAALAVARYAGQDDGP